MRGKLKRATVEAQRNQSRRLLQSFRKTSDEPLAWMLDHADPREKADRNFVSFISKNTFLSIQQLPYCNLSSHQSSRH